MTAEELFTTEPQHYVGTLRTGLGATLEQWTAAPADLLLSPTRYLRCDDAGERVLAEGSWLCPDRDADSRTLTGSRSV
ncbi:hypothetical protein Q8791_16455 [Nocardiopsis sp. CT-R113]|uniref:Uncharacterized protein n=1 Tax=Nocardiopsis codii TaxID=3065942 RepID=A0ABU7K993_9ACTN|nr:hypothetical protein [Nocardiopsis sp. CT-R113]MEE2038816.1 hypothetical protein [Nocardiopsis sp. CT-R113]